MALRSFHPHVMKELAEKDRRREDDELVALWAKLNDGQDLRTVSGYGRILQFASAWGNSIADDYEDTL